MNDHGDDHPLDDDQGPAAAADPAEAAPGAGEAHDAEPDGPFSRRSFLKAAGAGSAAALAACRTPARRNGSPDHAASPAATRDRVVGPAGVSVELTVNGSLRKLQVETRTTLADALREQLELTGTKVACDRGACGACTVQLDGEAVCSCMVLAVDADGRSVTTVEGLASGDDLHPLQRAFVERDALQCGFCTPGMLMSCKTLLDRVPEPTPQQIREAVAGNLCRCGTYPHVFDATALAATRMRAAASDHPQKKER